MDLDRLLETELCFGDPKELFRLREEEEDRFLRGDFEMERDREIGDFERDRDRLRLAGGETERLRARGGVGERVGRRGGIGLRALAGDDSFEFLEIGETDFRERLFVEEEERDLLIGDERFLRADLDSDRLRSGDDDDRVGERLL